MTKEKRAPSRICAQGKHEWCFNRDSDETHCGCECHDKAPLPSNPVAKKLRKMLAWFDNWSAAGPAAPGSWDGLTRKAADEIERLTRELEQAERNIARLRVYEQAYGVAYRATYQGHSSHWDMQGTAGANCPECRRAREAREQCQTILREALVSSPSETKWQPIATAPAGPWIFTGAFHKDGSGFWFDGPCSYSRDGIDLMRREGIRTHWAAAPRWLQDGPQQLETGEKHG